MWISKGEYELFESVEPTLLRDSALSWQSAKTPGGGRFSRQEECLCLTIHIATALHLFSSACTLDVTSTVMTRMHFRSSTRAHSPLSGSSVNESCAQDTEQKHGKHFSFFFFLPFFLVSCFSFFAFFFFLLLCLFLLLCFFVFVFSFFFVPFVLFVPFVSL